MQLVLVFDDFYQLDDVGMRKLGKGLHLKHVDAFSPIVCRLRECFDSNDLIGLDISSHRDSPIGAATKLLNNHFVFLHSITYITGVWGLGFGVWGLGFGVW